jgi:hypothetical protein
VVNGLETEEHEERGKTMTLFTLKGKPTVVSREQVRSFLWGSLTVLGYHGWFPESIPLDVRFSRDLGLDGGVSVAGLWISRERRVLLRSDLDHETMLMAVLHEVIHACRSFPTGTDEKCVSTLVARIKPDVAVLAHTLLAGTYRRAAFLAHTQLSYVAKGDDFYDEDQHNKVGVVPRYNRRRGARG